MSADEIYKIGQNLAPLREQQILLIGSVSITNNLRELSWNGYSGWMFPNGLQAFVILWCRT